MAELPIPDQTPTLASVIQGAISRRLASVRVALPARVESYDSKTQQVSIQPLIFDGYYDEAGERQSERLPVVNSVPVLFPGCGVYAITWPIAHGDTGLMVCSSSSLDRWLVNGGEVDPKDDRRHSISDAIFIPGLRDFGHPVPASGVDGSAMVISGGTGGIKLGDATATELMVLGNAFMTLFNNHVHPTGVGPSGQPATPMTTAQLSQQGNKLK